MDYKEESFVLDTLTEILENIRSPTFKQLVKETHENNVMLKDICNTINIYLGRHHQENEDDFMRNIMANIISSGIDINKIFKRK